ncbi:23S ribosomal RNA methyltransferase Erm [Streptomyces hoynatensis]|uniref:23S ribosomal RNA methyltransferase Erm n=1 Tax=Streptomyces hoynatensis TaxID=1141874 RepID=A0A3A9ZHI0_9ACTN|nr:23S ribosomal RNA methyltransferase Erm [Streptomyces hoynatensis]RKN47164.1 23S ribosomal RNA methyltransferase Erm [Streptomyces hoynatensis]
MASRRKTLSQNFLYHPGVLRSIAACAALRPGDLVVEPGAGEGALTRVLAGRAREVVAHELDPALAARLPRRVRGLPNVRVVRGDFLRSTPPRLPFVVVGNIPYARTTDIVRWCLRAPRLRSATLVTQLEYARRRTGGFGRWPLITVLSWPEHEWLLGPRIDRAHFTPVPRTHSAVLRLVRRPVPLLPPAELPDYRALVTAGFTGPGGSVRAALARGRRARRVSAALEAAGVPREATAGLVTPAQWLALHRRLAATRP